MKKWMTFITMALMLSVSTANAETTRVKGEVTSSNPITKDVTKTIPEQICEIASVPVYGKVKRQAQTGEVLGGAIIGGILGNQIGKGKGNDAATFLGAIIGADLANKNATTQQIIGYREVEQCEVVYVNTVVQQTVGYNTVVNVNGMKYTFKTKGQYAKGTIVFLNLSL